MNPGNSKILHVSIFCAFLVVYVIYRTKTAKYVGEILAREEKISVKREKIILYWTPAFRKVEDLYLGLGGKIFNSCEFSNCYTTSNRSRMKTEDFSAIIFHHLDFFRVDKPERRSKDQYYIFYTLESPSYTDRKPLDNFYNWTMTYTLNSDIIRPYGYYLRQDTDYQPPSVEKLNARPKKIFWMVSHCITHSGRENIVNEINRYMTVDIIGKCSGRYLNYCNESDAECYNFIENNYKFYLSFENSLCKDYVTEKLFNMLNLDIIPIVYGSANYAKIAPPNSYINVRDFHDIKDLVTYLSYLDRYANLYVSYFEWKKQFVIKNDHQPALCTLCEKLNQVNEPRTYNNLNQWWSSGTCETITNFSVFPSVSPL